MLVYFSVSLCLQFLAHCGDRPVPLQLIRDVISNNPPFVYGPTRTNQPGHLGHSQGNIPYQGRDCFCYFVIHIFLYDTPQPLVR